MEGRNLHSPLSILHLPLSILPLIFQQHIDSVSFLRGEASGNRGLWRAAWLFRLCMALAVLAILGTIAPLTGSSWVVTVAHAVLAFVPVMVAIGVVVMMTGHAEFWLLYLCSPPMLLIALLCGLGPVTPVGWLLGWGVGTPLFLSALLLDACAVWVHNRTRDAQHKQSRRRAGGPVAEMPALALWGRVRSIRLVTAASCVLLATAVILLFQHDQMAYAGSFALLMGAAGCLRLDVALLGWIRESPLVAYDEQRHGWRTTYIGRSALFVPLGLVCQVMAPDLSALRPACVEHSLSRALSRGRTAQGTAVDASAALLALLGQSSLGPVVRSAVAHLSLEQAHWLVLDLSLQEGGAAAIRYLRPALSQSLRLTVERYAALADEAAKPLDLQRWIAVLTSRPFCAEEQGSRGAGEQGGGGVRGCGDGGTLDHARDALLSYEYAPALDEAVRDLRQLIQTLYGVAVPVESREQPQHLARSETGQSKERVGAGQSHSGQTLPLSWPVALLMHVESHRTRLLSD